ncbi:hypothetical protein F2Q69_00033565 [Brassica cretica]|uniref:Uncharacterized protein n=1 Tax=Brassica cretica TaxID=69181 RepID=A0A8S9SQQ2_BRACR|nr:hypothetical protein F2Q69_00033565 [Brassica cretica]
MPISSVCSPAGLVSSAPTGSDLSSDLSLRQPAPDPLSSQPSLLSLDHLKKNQRSPAPLCRLVRLPIKLKPYHPTAE